MYNEFDVIDEELKREEAEIPEPVESVEMVRLGVTAQVAPQDVAAFKAAGYEVVQ